MQVVTNDPIPRRHFAIHQGWLRRPSGCDDNGHKESKFRMSLDELRHEVANHIRERVENNGATVLPPKEPLTERETLIMQLSALGYTNRQVGEVAGISDQTVKNHKTNVFRKLGLNGESPTIEAIRRMVILGLVHFP